MIISQAFNYSQVDFFCLNTQTSIAVTSAGVEPGRAGQFLFSAILRNKPEQKLGGGEKKESKMEGWLGTGKSVFQLQCNGSTKDLPAYHQRHSFPEE